MQKNNETSREEKIEKIKLDASKRARKILEERKREARVLERAKSQVGSNKAQDQPVRAINEDDDGYDPYSDYHDLPTEEPLFQQNPWE